MFLTFMLCALHKGAYAAHKIKSPELPGVRAKQPNWTEILVQFSSKMQKNVPKNKNNVKNRKKTLQKQKKF